MAFQLAFRRKILPCVASFKYIAGIPFEQELVQMRSLYPVWTQSKRLFSLSLPLRISFRRSNGPSNTDESTSDAKKFWLETIDEFQHRDLDPVRNMMALSGVELRQWKKRAFLHVIETYLQRYGATKRNFTKFAQNALEQMPDYEVEEDLQCYKAVLRLFPTGRMVVRNFLQAEWGHYVGQQNTVILLLQQMAKHHVLPDDEVGQMIINIFGWRNHAMQHYRHMMYWLPKLYHANPWPVSNRIKDDLDVDPICLARAIAERICPDRTTLFRLVQASKSKTTSGRPESLISAQSDEQRALLTFYENRQRKSLAPAPVYVDGPRFVWYSTLQAAYYTIWTDLDQDRLLVEQDHVKKRAHKFVGSVPLNEPLDDPFLNQVPQKATQKHLLNFYLPTDNKRNQHSVSIYRTTNNLPTTTKIAKAEPEYDDRWQHLRQGHVYHFLPTHLSSHEQAEGTILALGVVTPQEDALMNQTRLYDWTIANKLAYKEQSNRSQEHESTPPCAFVPRFASPDLLRSWLRDLELSNPDLEQMTVLIRVPPVESEPIMKSKKTNESLPVDESLVDDTVQSSSRC